MFIDNDSPVDDSRAV